LSATVLESTSKSIFTNCRSFTHSIVCNSPRASPVSTSMIGENQSVRANTKAPFASLMKMHVPTLSILSEKAASTLHLYLPSASFDHVSIWVRVLFVRAAILTSWAFFQLAKNAVALLQIVWHVSETSFQILLFPFFQMLHISVPKRAWFACCTRSRISSRVEAMWLGL